MAKKRPAEAKFRPEFAKIGAKGRKKAHFWAVFDRKSWFLYINRGFFLHINGLIIFI
jgi:hypothetical protein